MKTKFVFGAGLVIGFLALPLTVQAQSRAPSSRPQGLDAASQDALEKTQQLLTNRIDREEAIKKDPKAQRADGMVQSLFGADASSSDAVYQLASEVFSQIVRESNGDAKDMQKRLESFKRDPAAFAASWTPEQKAKLKALSDKIQHPPAGQMK